MKIIAPSLLSADFYAPGEQLQILEKLGCEWLHLDVMDGMFVPSISFGMPVIKSLRKKCGLYFDVHMMVQDPERYIVPMKEAGAEMLSVHAEACRHLDRTLSEIRESGMKSAVALNPSTPLAEVEYVLDKTDMILLMTVNPGFGGQSYIPGMTRKIADLKELLIKKGRDDILIEVDGGVNTKTAEQILEAGADVLVAGSAVFGGDISERYLALCNIAKKF